MRVREPRQTRLFGPIVNAFWAGDSIIAYSRNEQGHVAKRSYPAEYVSFVRLADATQSLRDQLRSSRSVLGFREDGDFLRIRWVSHQAAKKTAERGGWFERVGVKAYEADVDPVRRWIVDHDVPLQRPRRCYLDFEADSRVSFSELDRMRILAWSIVNEDGSTFRAEVLREESDQAEREMVVQLWELLCQYDQIAAWNGDRFDFVLLDFASQRLKVPVDVRRWLWIDHMVVFKRLNVSASESGDEKQSMALGSVAKSVLGDDEEKLVKLGRLGGPTSYDIWKSDPELLRAYCLDDSQKMRKIEVKTGYLDLAWTISELTHTLPNTRVQNPTRFVEGYLLEIGKRRGIKFPTWSPPPKDDGSPAESDEPEPFHEPVQFRGAFVLEPTKRGILRDVHVCDFARLYPSMILSFNLSPETWRSGVVLRESEFSRPSYLMHVPLKQYPRPPGTCEVPLVDRVFDNEPRGVLAEAIEEMLALRKTWDDKKKSFAPGTIEWKDADRRSTAYKNMTNAFFGVVGSCWSRFYVREVAESIAQAGAWLIKETIKQAEDRHWRVIYGDTDSCFVCGPTRAEFQQWTEDLNSNFFPALLKTKGCTRCTVKLEAEKGFSVLAMIRNKGYAGRYAYFKGTDAKKDSKPEIKGLEYKRGDSIRIARRMQEELIHLLLEDYPDAEQRCVELVERWRKRVLEEPLALEDVLMSKALSKAVREYKHEKKQNGEWAARPPHVEVAALLHERGRAVSTGVRIEYFVVDGSSSPKTYSPAEDWKGECDRFGVWEDAVYPPSQRVLEACFPQTSWERWAKVRPKKQRARPENVVDMFDVGRQKPLGVVVEKAVKARMPKVNEQESLFPLLEKP